MKLTNGKKIIERNEQDYQKNLNTWTFRGWKPVSNVQENIKEVDQTLSNEKMITLTRNNKTITRSQLDYETNKVMYDFRGFKPVQDDVKENIKEVDQTFENETKVVPIKSKKKKAKKK